MRGALLSFLIVALTACGPSRADAPAPVSWCRGQTFEGSRFTICDNNGGNMQLFAAGPKETQARSFAELSRKVDPAKVAFAMNAGMFDENGRPIGLAIAEHHGMVHRINLRDGPGNFHMKPNGVFRVSVSGKASIVESGPMPMDVVRVYRFATQSGPLLVYRGKLHPKIEPDGQSRLIRNGVGVTGEGKALFVISEDPVSFGKLARFFRDQLHTPDALYFDGSVSSLWDPPDGRQDSQSELGPIIVAFKPEASAPGRGGRATP